MTVSRRQFVQGVGVAGLGLLAGCGRLPGQAQPQANVPRLGFLATVSPTPNQDAFFKEFNELGYVDGQNVVIDYRWTEGRDEQLPTLAAELVRLDVDVIVTQGTNATLAARSATATIPIVQAVGAGDLVREGVAVSLARPGGNVTGLTEIGPELTAKRLELLKDAVSGLARVAVLRQHPPSGSAVSQFEETQSAAQALGIQLHYLEVRGPDDFEGLLDTAIRERADALFMLVAPIIIEHHVQIATLAVAKRLPAMFDRRGFAVAGGLMAYGPVQADMFRRSAHYVDRILKGVKPADLPIERPREFAFVVNLKTAQALGLTIPQHVLLQATEVIQ